MTITTHTAIAVAIGTTVGNPILGFIFGLVSHYLVDAIPHGDMHLREADHLVNKQKEASGVTLVIVDMLFGVGLLSLLGTLLPNDVTRSATYIAAIAGSVLPDALVGMNDLIKSKPGRAHTQLHFFFHDYFCRKHGDTKLPYSLMAQGLFVLGVIAFVA
jgi:hypothetical protein